MTTNESLDITSILFGLTFIVAAIIVAWYKLKFRKRKKD